jgi:hypothetical protein
LSGSSTSISALILTNPVSSLHKKVCQDHVHNHELCQAIFRQKDTSSARLPHALSDEDTSFARTSTSFARIAPGKAIPDKGLATPKKVLKRF